MIITVNTSTLHRSTVQNHRHPRECTHGQMQSYTCTDAPMPQGHEWTSQTPTEVTEGGKAREIISMCSLIPPLKYLIEGERESSRGFEVLSCRFFFHLPPPTMSSVLHSFHPLHPRSPFSFPNRPAFLILLADLTPFIASSSGRRSFASHRARTHTRVAARLIIVACFPVALEAWLWRASLFKDALGCGRQLKG